MSLFPMPFGPYVLERFIAAGGMAEVFLARLATEGDGTIAGPLCVKRMLPEMMKTQEYVTMFKDEARLSQRLVHPHIVRVFDSGEVDGKLYMAMEYVDGMDVGSLQKKLRIRGELLGVGHALRIAIDICAGLHYAHTLGVDLVHRDISPQNILIAQHGDVKLTDFGIAKAVGRETRTQTGMIKGKVQYMAPEQALGHAIDQRVDQFAAGIVVWEMVTGQRLYAEKSDNLNFEKIIRQPPAKPSSTRSGIPPIVDAVILRALAKKPDDRYPGCNAFQAALSQALSSLGPAAKSDIGPVMAHVLGAPTKDAREVSKPARAPPPAASSAPPPANTLAEKHAASPGPPGHAPPGNAPPGQRRGGRPGGLEVMAPAPASPPPSQQRRQAPASPPPKSQSVADDETILSGDAPTRKTPSAAAAAPIAIAADAMRLPTDALMPLPVDDGSSSDELPPPARDLHDAETLYDPGTMPPTDRPPDATTQEASEPRRPPATAAAREASSPRTQTPAAVAREASNPRMASPTPSITVAGGERAGVPASITAVGAPTITQPASSPRLPAAVAPMPMPMPLSQLPMPASRMQSTSAPAPAAARSTPYAAFAAILVVGVAVGFGAAKLIPSAASEGAAACPFSSAQEPQRQKAAAVLNAARDAYDAGDLATADKLVDGSVALSGSAGAEMLRGRMSVARGDRLGALAHFRCVTALEPSSADAAAVANALESLRH